MSSKVSIIYFVVMKIHIKCFFHVLLTVIFYVLNQTFDLSLNIRIKITIYLFQWRYRVFTTIYVPGTNKKGMFFYK